MSESAPVPTSDESTTFPLAPKASPMFPLAPQPSLALAVLCGLLYFAAFPGCDVWPVAFIAWVPLLVALHRQTPRRAAATSWAAGVVMILLGFHWLLGMLETFSGFPTAACALIMLLLCMFLAGRTALMGWLYARANELGWHPRLTIFPAFIASELIYPVLFHWYFGATVHQVPVLTQVAELGNPIAVGLALLATNVAIAELIIARLEGAVPLWKATAGLLMITASAAIYGVVRLAQVDAMLEDAPKKHVGLVQANMGLMAKRTNRAEGLARHLRLTNSLREQGPLDLVVWSETSVAGAVPEKYANEYYERLFSRRLGVPAIFGALLTRRVEDARGYVLYNSSLISDRAGTVQGRYDKQFLLAFGEYLPFGEQFPSLYKLSPHTGRFTPGKSLAPLPLGEFNINVHICYEDIIPSFVNSMLQDEPVDLLVNMTNDAWYGDTTEPWIHVALASFRSIEHRKYMVRSTNSGVSAIIDPAGRVVANTGTFVEAALVEEIAFLRGPRTPYELYGDSPWWLGTVASIYMAFRSRRRPVPVSAAPPETPAPQDSENPEKPDT